MNASVFALVNAFHKRSLFWPPESFTLNPHVDERVSEWLANIFFKHEDVLACVASSTHLNMHSLAQQLRSNSSEHLTKCIFEYWLLLINERFASGKSFCKDTAVWLCKYLQVDSSSMLWASNGVGNGFENGTSNGAEASAVAATEPNEGISFTVTFKDVEQMKRNELLYWKYKLIVYISSLGSESSDLLSRATALLRAVENRL